MEWVEIDRKVVRGFTIKITRKDKLTHDYERLVLYLERALKKLGWKKGDLVRIFKLKDKDTYILLYNVSLDERLKSKEKENQNQEEK